MNYNQFRDKYRIILMTLTYLTILALFYFTFTYAHELSTHPLVYVGEKYNMSYCMDHDNTIYSFNESGVWVKPSEIKYNG